MIAFSKYTLLGLALAVLSAGCAVETQPSDEKQGSEISSSVNDIVAGDVGNTVNAGQNGTPAPAGQKDPRSIQEESFVRSSQPQPQPWVSEDPGNPDTPQPQPWNPDANGSTKR